ncbi:13058_t:CDS:2, partial [Funneliformis geosporum]
IVINEAYREKMAEFDPSFVVLGEQKIKTMIVKSCKYNQENLRNLLTKTAENVSLTMDLWSSKAKHGYLEDIPSNLDLIAALLDPCYKNLDFLENADEKKQIIQKLHNKLSEVEVSGFEILNNPALSQDIESSIRSHKEYRQQRQKKIKKAVTNVVISDEVTNYLSLLLALETEDPLN